MNLEYVHKFAKKEDISVVASNKEARKTKKFTNAMSTPEQGKPEKKSEKQDYEDEDMESDEGFLEDTSDEECDF